MKKIRHLLTSKTVSLSNILIEKKNNKQTKNKYSCCLATELNDNVDLISLEKLDRGSPEIWPEKSTSFSSDFNSQKNTSKSKCLFYFYLCRLVPGVNEFAALNSINNNDEQPPAWTQGLSQEDINAMHRKCN